MKDNGTVSTLEAAALLGVSRNTVIRMVKRGELRAYRKTRAYRSPLRVFRDSVREVIEKQGRQLPEAVPDGG
jgi:excisionase family DNA binding protein